MRSSLTESSDPPAADALQPATHPTAPQVAAATPAEPAEPRNFVVMVAYLVVMRAGWIFKTESIIMPFVLDSLGGSALLRGLLPLFNRFGQSIPPLLVARRVKILPQKKWALIASTTLMCLAFLSLSAIWAVADGVYWWMPYAFLGLYLLFFISTGINQLIFNTLQGKLIEATHRGRLMLVANLVGAAVAIGLVLLLLPRWLRPEGADFVPIFAFTGCCFAVAALLSLWLVEYRDGYQQAPMQVHELFATAWQTLRADANFRRLALVAASFSCTMMLFPHYQALGRGERLGLQASNLLWWVVLQNAGTALFSFMAGPLADARGNRIVLRSLLLAICAAPLMALGIARFGGDLPQLYSLVFVLIGLTPVGIKVLNNYTLEVAPAAEHPRYLSTLSLCMAAPIPASPLLGWLIGRLGFEAVFLTITGIVLAGWLTSFTLVEPRHDPPDHEQRAA